MSRKKALAVELGEFVAGLRFEDLPPAVVDKAKAVVNHAVTVGMAGFDARELNRGLRRELHLSRRPPGYFVPIELAGGSGDRPQLRVVD